MSLTRVLGRTSRTVLSQCRNYQISANNSSSPINSLSVFCNRFHSMSKSPLNEASPLHNGLSSTVSFPHRGMSTFATSDKEQGKSAEKNEDNGSADAAKQADEGSTVEPEASEQSQEPGSTSESQPTSQSVKRERRGTKRTAFSDSESEVEMDELSREDLVKLVLEKDEALQKQLEEYKELKDTYLRSYAEMENRMERTRREAENSKKFAVQSFAKSLLDVADNLERASSETRKSLKKFDASEDTVGALPEIKTLLDGVAMTEKQLADVLGKAGIVKYVSVNEQFDPNRHNAVFQVSDDSRPPGTVAVVLKAGYTLHDRILRPAEVGVTVASEDDEADS